MKELINIIKNRSNRNTIALKKYNERLFDIIETNNKLYVHLYMEPKT